MASADAQAPAFIERKALIERLAGWAKSDDESNRRVAVLSAPSGTGKTTACRAVASRMAGEEERRVVYFEFPGGVVRNKDGTAQACLFAFIAVLFELYGGEVMENDPEFASRKTRPNPLLLDPLTLFAKYISRPLARIGQESERAVPIFFVIDGPERCDPFSKAALLHILFQQWPSTVDSKYIKLLVITGLSPKALEKMSLLPEDNIEVITRLAAKQASDEVIVAMFENALKAEGIDVEWEGRDHLERLAKHCEHSIFLARYIIQTPGLLHSKYLPETLEEVMKREYKPWMGPMLCARASFPLDYESNPLLDRTITTSAESYPLPLVELLLSAQGCLDWFVQSDKDRCRREGHVAAYRLLSARLEQHEAQPETDPRDDFVTQHLLFHAMETGEAELARDILLKLPLLMRFARADALQLIRDADLYCQKRPQDVACRIIRNCLLQARRALVADPRQLPAQLLGRISGVASDIRADVEISNFLSACRNYRPPDFMWFRPVRASLSCVPETTQAIIRGHSDTVLSVSITPLDALWPRMALSGSCDGTAKLWDLLSGRCELTLECPGSGYCSGVVLQCLDEQNLVALTSSQDGNSRLWWITKQRGFVELSSPFQVLIGHDKEVTGCALVPGNHTVAATSSADMTARIWTLPSSPAGGEAPKCLHTLSGHSQPVLCISFIPAQYNMVATGSKDRTIRLWSVSSGACLSVFGGHFSHVTSIAFRSDGNIFATGGWDSIARIWTVGEALNAELADPSAAEVSQERRVQERCMLVHKDWVWSVAFVESDRDLLVTGTDNGVIRLWSISTHQCVLAFDGHLGAGVYCLGTLGGDFVVSGGIDGTVRLFDVSSKRITNNSSLVNAESWSSLDQPHRFQGPVTAIAFPAQGLKKRLCVIASADKSLRAFDLNSGRCIKRLNLPESKKHGEAYITALKVSEDHNKLQTTDDRGVRLVWNRTTLELEQRKKGNPLLSCFSCGCGYGETFSECEGVEIIPKRPPTDGTFVFDDDEIMDEFQIDQEGEDGKVVRPVAAFTVDSLGGLKCWCSPPIASDDEFIEGVLVLTEPNGLVHVLHPMV